jgi:hypothetical protein
MNSKIMDGDVSSSPKAKLQLFSHVTLLSMLHYNTYSRLLKLRSTASESAPPTVDAPPAARQQVPAPKYPDIKASNGKNSVQYVIDSLPRHLGRVAPVEAFLEEAADIPSRGEGFFLEEAAFFGCINKFSPGSCTNIRYGKCSENHATKEHPESDRKLKCLVCSEKHYFNRCPQRQMASKKDLKTGQKSYKEAMFSQARKPTRKVPAPEPLERLLLTPNTMISVTWSLVSSQTFLSIQNWSGNNKMARKQPERTQRDSENDDKVSSEDMDVDTQKSHLTRKRPEDNN